MPYYSLRILSLLSTSFSFRRKSRAQTFLVAGMSSDASSGVLLKIRAVPLGGEGRTTLSEDDFRHMLRDAGVRLFGNVSGLIDFEVVDFAEDTLTVKTDKNQQNKLWSALTLYAPSHSLFTVTGTMEA